MEIEQIIELFQISGFILILPVIFFLVGVIRSITLLNTPLPEPEATTSQEPLCDENAETVSAAPARKERRRKNVPAPVVPASKPVVIMSVPEEAQQALASIWTQIPDIPSTWDISISKEEIQ